MSDHVTVTDAEAARLRAAIPNTKVRQIICGVAARFGLTGSDLIGPSQRAHIVNGRYSAIHAVRQAKPHFSLERIGGIFGGRNHTTILHALRKMEREGIPQPPAGLSAGGGR